MYNFRKLLLRVRKLYVADARALSLMRIAIALTVIYDLALRAGDMEAHYTNTGLWPTNLALSLASKSGMWSIHNLSGNWWWIFTLFILHFATAFLLLLGYKTRLTTLFVWLFTISLHNRNIYILQAGDDLLRLLLFWGLFLPWGAHYSIDCIKKHPVQKHLFGSLGYFCLLASVYFFSVNLKSSNEWFKEGSAVYYALSLDQIRLPFLGNCLYKFPHLMQLLTRIVYCTEFVLPVLILWPSQKGIMRMVAFLLIVLLHVGIGLTLYVGLFFVISIISAIGLVPSCIINKLERKHSPSFLGHRRNKALKFDTAYQWLAPVLIILCFFINLSSLSWFAFELRKKAGCAVNALRLDQYWGMFSPTVLKKDGWYVYEGIDSHGKQWDLRLNRDYVDFKKPRHIVSMYKTDRWRKLAENMQNNYYTFLRPQYAKYFLKNWNKKHPEKKMITLNLYFMEEESLPGYQTKAVTKNLFCVCNDI